MVMSDRLKPASDQTVSALKSLLVRAWRERWSDVQWSTRLKEVLPGGSTGDDYNLAALILDQALLAPIPNQLVLGYLRHALAVDTVSHAALLECISGYDFTSSIAKRRPHCTATLLELVVMGGPYRTSGGTSEESISLAVALLKTTSWLLKTVSNILLMGTEHLSQPKHRLDLGNCQSAIRLLNSFVSNEFILSLLYIGKAEEKDTFVKMLSTCKRIGEQLKTIQLTFCEDPVAFKQELNRMVGFIASSNLDPLKGALLKQQRLSYVHVIQPMVLFEALFKPLSDLVTLSSHLQMVGQVNGMSYSDLVYEIIRSLLLSISSKEGLETLKVDAFLLIKLPHLLERLYLQMKGSDSGPPFLKTPTDLYKAFDRLLKNDALLDSVDVRCRCNCVETLIKVINGRCRTQLMTETERDDVLKGRKQQLANKDDDQLLRNPGESGAAAGDGIGKEADKVSGKEAPVNQSGFNADNQTMPKAETFPADVLGNLRSLDLTLKAEGSLSNLFRTLEASDVNKPESVESLLDVLRKIVNGERLDLLVTASAANGQLGTFVSCIVKFNQRSQESQGESVKNSLLRAALFDLTFLIVVYIAQSFGPEVVLAECKGTFMHGWISEMLLETDEKAKLFQKVPIPDNMTDSLLQQLSNGDLRTQVVKWQNVCMNIHLVMKDILVARCNRVVPDARYKKMLATLSSKLCALPICVVAWFAFYRRSGVCGTGGIQPELIAHDQLLEVADEFSQMAAKNSSSSASPSTERLADPMASEMPYLKERSALMACIMTKILVQAGLKDAPERTVSNVVGLGNEGQFKSLMRNLWLSKIVRKGGRLDIDSAWQLDHLFRCGGARQFVSYLVGTELLSLMYESELDRATEVLTSIFHIDIQACTLALLLHVAPELVASEQKRDKLSDPHGAALAKLLVGMVFSALAPERGGTSTTLKTTTPGSKRTGDPLPEEQVVPSVKMSRLMMAPSSGPESHGNQSAEGSTRVSQALASFFRVLYSAICSQDEAPTSSCTGRTTSCSCGANGTGCSLVAGPPVTQFAFRVVEQVALLGGSSSRSKLIFQHLPPNFVQQLIKVTPGPFSAVSFGLVTRLFDISSPIGRRNMAMAACLLRSLSRQHGDGGGSQKAPSSASNLNRPQQLWLQPPVVSGQTQVSAGSAPAVNGVAESGGNQSVIEGVVASN